MPKYIFGKASQAKLVGVHPSLILVVTHGLNYMDLSIIGGVRDLATQKIYVEHGLSKTMDSRHLIQPSGYGEALDLTPYANFNWDVPKANNDLLIMGGMLMTVAADLGIKIRYGGDWNCNWRNTDNGFQDLDHIELLRS